MLYSGSDSSEFAARSERPDERLADSLQALARLQLLVQFVEAVIAGLQGGLYLSQKLPDLA